MTMITLGKRLSALEATRATAPVHMTEEEKEEARQQYERYLADPPPSDPRAVAYWERTSLLQLAADYQAMLKGAPAPWLRD